MRQKKKFENDRWLVNSTIWLAGVTTFLAVFTFGLWLATYRLAKEAKESAATQIGKMEMALSISRNAANAAKESADATTRSVEAAVVSSMPILVPFVPRATDLYPDNLIVEPYTPRLNFVFQNFGATPGIVRQVRAELFLVTQDQLPDVDVNALGTIHQEIIVPGKLTGEAAKIPGSDVECRPFRPITIEEHKMLLKETRTGEPFQRFYLFGQVIYDDFFDTRHTATFCLKVRKHGYHGPHGGARYNRITREPIPKNQDT
jgi:hypothetical protein